MAVYIGEPAKLTQPPSVELIVAVRDPLYLLMKRADGKAQQIIALIKCELLVVRASCKFDIPTSRYFHLWKEMPYISYFSVAGSILSKLRKRPVVALV